jgi:hypothetical protein
MHTTTTAKVPSFRQLCAIVRQVITTHPTDTATDLKDRIKCQHVTLGYRYNTRQIPRALDAVERTMGRDTLTPAQIATLRPLRARPPTQADPPWPGTRGPSQWTRLTDCTTNRRSDRST